MKHKYSPEGMTAIVTGASSGIGLQFSHRLAEQGCNLLMVSNQSKELAEHSASLREKYGVRVDTLDLDLTARDAADKILEYMDANGLQPDILINNAGIFSFTPVIDTDPRKIDCFIDLHVGAVTRLSRAFALRMKERGRGYILNMSSMSCWMPMPGIAMYSSTKSYIRVFSRALHYEMRDYGVSVTVAAPGGIATDLFGLPDNLKKLALNLGAITTPEKFTRNAVKKMMYGKQQYINGLTNRLAIVAVGCLPTSARMLVKRLMLDKNIRRP